MLLRDEASIRTAIDQGRKHPGYENAGLNHARGNPRCWASQPSNLHHSHADIVDVNAPMQNESCDQYGARSLFLRSPAARA